MFQGDRVAISAEDGPLVAHLDGEIRAPGRADIDITLVPGALRVLAAAA